MTALEIVIIDDDEGDRKLVRRLLSKSGLAHHVHEAQGAHDLRQTSDAVDAVFLDYLLPGADGLALLSELRQRWPRAAIILMTGQGDEEVAKSAIMLGAADYISKSSLNQDAVARMLKRGIEAARLKWRLDEQRRELSTFSEVLVHDFKAPIRAADYLAARAEEAMENDDPEGARESLTMLRRSVRQMAELVDSLASHIRLDREQQPTTVEAGDIVKRALAALEHDIAVSHAKIEVETEVPPFECLAAQVAQLLQNLIANAIKYRGDDPPHIRITAEPEPGPGGAVRFAVADNGPGIAAEYREKIFEPFTRAPSRSAAPGTGLGLATCRKIVRRHGGRIWCESELGTGTTILFTILPQRVW